MLLVLGLAGHGTNFLVLKSPPYYSALEMANRSIARMCDRDKHDIHTNALSHYTVKDPYLNQFQLCFTPSIPNR